MKKTELRSTLKFCKKNTDNFDDAIAMFGMIHILKTIGEKVFRNVVEKAYGKVDDETEKFMLKVKKLIGK